MMMKSTAVSALTNAQFTGFHSLSPLNGEDAGGLTPQRAKLAHVTLFQLSQRAAAQAVAFLCQS